MTAPLSRRRALTGAATLGVGAPILAACAPTDDRTTGESAELPASDPTTDGTTSSAAPSPDARQSSEATGGAAARGLVAAADVPVGGGVVLEAEELVVTQPVAGEFKAFSAICTHNRCLVGSVTDGVITCPCHNSTFSAADGSVTGGPAPTALPAVAVKVANDQVVKA